MTAAITVDQVEYERTNVCHETRVLLSELHSNLMSESGRLHCRSSVSVLLHQLWFGSMQGERGEGDNRDPSLQFSLLQYATSLSTPFIFIHYTAIWSSWGWVMLNRIFFLNNRCATGSYPTCYNFGPCKCNRETVSYPQDVCKLCERACKANTWRQSKLSDRFFQKWGTWAHMLCWWLFLHHHAHTYPSVKGNELSPCKISSQSLREGNTHDALHT